MLTVLMFTVGRGNDIFNFVEDLFEKNDRQFNDVNFPAIFVTTLVTSLLANAIPCGDTTPTPEIGIFFEFLSR